MSKRGSRMELPGGLERGTRVIEPLGARAGWAVEEQRMIIQILLPGRGTAPGMTVAYALPEDMAYKLCDQIIDIGVKLREES